MFTQLKNDGSQDYCKMSICAKTDIIIISFDEMITKGGNQERGRHLVILDYFTVWTHSIIIDYVNTDLDPSLK